MPDPAEQLPASTKPSLLKRWLGWRILALSAVVLILLSPVLYRGWRLGQVPTVDEPFDVEEYLREIPKDENACFGFEQAGRELRRISKADYVQYQIELEEGWDFDTAVLDRHLENNRLALDTWRSATEKRIFQSPVELILSGVPDIEVGTTRELNRLASTKIQKLVKTNRPDAAIPWIRAQLRFSHLIRQRGPEMNCTVGAAVFSQAAETVNDWSIHPELSRQEIDQAREALADARHLNPLLSDIVKAECISAQSCYALWNANHASQLNKVREMLGMETSTESDWKVWLEAEPEYTVRLFPHIARNHLLFIESDRRDRPPLLNGDLFDDTTSAPPKREELRAADLAELVESSLVLSAPQLEGLLSFIDRDESIYRCLTIALACQAYFRDRGEFPEKAAELIPEYLDEIPDDLYSPTPAPLIYRRDGDGAVVYSRFTNEYDDGGTEVNYDERSIGGELLDLGFRIRNPFDRPLSAPKPARD